MLNLEYWQNSYEYASWHSILLFSSFWSLSYLFSNKIILRPKNPQISSRIISFFHGTIIAFIGINQCFLIDWPFDHPEWRTTNIQKVLIVTSLGYFIHDLAWSLVYQTETNLMIAHHCYSIIALCRMLFKGYSGAQTACALGCMEITNPFLQIRWFLRSLGFYSDSIVFTSVEITYFSVFVLVRILLGSYFLVIIVGQPKNDYDFVLFSFSIYVMSWMFTVEMIKYCFKKYYGRNKNNS